MGKEVKRPKDVDWQKRIINERRVKFNHKLADSYLCLPAFQDIEREISNEHVEHLTKSMENGSFLVHQAAISIAVCGWDNAERKLNGQHISWARSYYENNKYDVKTEDEYRQLYACFDRNRVRTVSHLAKMALYGTPEYENVKKSIIPYLTSAARFWRFGASRVKSDEVYKALRYEFPEIGRLAAELVTYVRNMQQNHLRRAPVIAAMMESLKCAKATAMEFWTVMVDGIFKSKTDPAKILHDYLHRTTVGSRITTTERKTVSGEEMFNVCVACFNAYKGNMQLTKTPPGKRTSRVIAR
jgi:transcription termination factor NusB